VSKFAGLLALFTIIPLIELALLIPLGQMIGLWPTIGLVVLTGLVGAFLGKAEGLKAWRRIQDDLAHARMPGDAILDGLAVLIACAFLVTPGVLTDIAGMALLIPIARQPIKALIRRRFLNMLESPGSTGFFQFSSFESVHGSPDFYPPRGAYGGEDIIDVTPPSSSSKAQAPGGHLDLDRDKD
jgi:UPF0716 protein FxsA